MLLPPHPFHDTLPGSSHQPYVLNSRAASRLSGGLYGSHFLNSDPFATQLLVAVSYFDVHLLYTYYLALKWSKPASSAASPVKWLRLRSQWCLAGVVCCSILLSKISILIEYQNTWLGFGFSGYVCQRAVFFVSTFVFSLGCFCEGIYTPVQLLQSLG